MIKQPKNQFPPFGVTEVCTDELKDKLIYNKLTQYKFCNKTKSSWITFAFNFRLWSLIIIAIATLFIFLVNKDKTEPVLHNLINILYGFSALRYPHYSRNGFIITWIIMYSNKVKLEAGLSNDPLNIFPPLLLDEQTDQLMISMLATQINDSYIPVIISRYILYPLI